MLIFFNIFLYRRGIIIIFFFRNYTFVIFLLAWFDLLSFMFENRLNLNILISCGIKTKNNFGSNGERNKNRLIHKSVIHGF